MQAEEPSFASIVAAAERIAPYIHHTPLLAAEELAVRAGAAEVWLKCENLQHIGAFKARGACNALFSLDDEVARHGVVTHSSGNHGAALAWAARLRGIPATVVMPHDAPAVKQRLVEEAGARRLLCEPGLAAREAALARLRAESAATLIHPYDHPAVIAGQGTVALEMLREQPQLDALMAPVSGGGLLSGIALAAVSHASLPKVYGVEPANVDDAFRSLQSGRLMPATGQPTLADGLRASLSERTFGILRQHVSAMFLASEAEIVAAMAWAWQRLKLVIEPSAAVVLAVLLQRPPALQGKRVGVVLSGGNLDLERPLPWQTPLA